MKNIWHLLLISVFFILVLSACGETASEKSNTEQISSDLQSSKKYISTVLEYQNEASGTDRVSTDTAAIDFSNANDGYVMVQYSGTTEKKIKAIVSGPQDDYTYSVATGKWLALPLSQGNGTYRVSLYENIEGTKYAQVLTAEFEVKLTDEFAPFIRPNVFADYSAAPNSVYKARELTDGKEDNLEKVDLIYDFVTKTLTYDTELAKTVKSGYIPDMDQVLSKGSGICFDYASLMTGMLRASGVPCKLVVGYVGDLYHAWISVWVDGQGWIDNAIYFDGTKWERLDPTLASAEKYKLQVSQFVGDGTNYSAKYYY